jgi:hypothetical protein
MPSPELVPNGSEPEHSPLLDALNAYVRHYTAGTITGVVKSSVMDAMNQEQRQSVYAEIAEKIWDLYSVIDVDLAVLILRKWLSIDPGSREARRALGSYLLAHGPDWDQEGYQLLEDAQE